MADIFELYNRYKGDANAFAKNAGVTVPQAREFIKGMNKLAEGTGVTTKTKTGGGVTDKIATAFGGGLTFIQSILETQEAGGYFRSLSEEMINVKDAFGLVVDQTTKKMKGPIDILKGFLAGAVNQVNQFYKDQTVLLEEVNKKTGLTGQLSKDFREEITNANPRLLQLGISFGDLSNAAIKLVDQTGKFNLINQQTFERAGEVAAAYVGTLEGLVGMYPEFEKVGIGAADASEAIAGAGKRSLELGLSSQKVTKDLSAQLGKLNEYGFRNGVRGLEEMVRKSLEFRMNMDNVYQIAEKVFEPDKAIELAANLQVLGGAIGDFNDPLRLMYMATNNVEGLQDALIGAAGSLATYNQEQGRFEITGVNLRRAKAMATELGMSLSDLSKTAIASAERASATGALLARGLTLDDDQKRFITNLAQMKGGEMVIELQSERLKEAFGNVSQISLDNLDQSNAELLLKYQDEFKQLSDNDIVRNQAQSIENIKRDVNFMAAVLRIQAGRAGQVAAEAAGLTGKDFARETFEAVKAGRVKVEDLSADLQEQLKKWGIDLKQLVRGVSTTPPQSKMTQEEMRKQEADKAKQTTQSSTNPQPVSKQEFSSAMFDALVMMENRRGKDQVEVNINANTSNPGEYTTAP